MHHTFHFLTKHNIIYLFENQGAEILDPSHTGGVTIYKIT